MGAPPCCVCTSRRGTHFKWHESGQQCYFFFLLSVGLPVANAPDVLQPCGLLYYPWCSNSHHQSSPQEILAVRGGAKPYYFYTFQLSPLVVSPEILVAKGGTMWTRNGRWILPEIARLPRNIQESFTCRKSTTWDRRLYFPSEGRRAEVYFALKNPTASAGFEPASLGTKGQHASSRPPMTQLYR